MARFSALKLCLFLLAAEPPLSRAMKPSEVVPHIMCPACHTMMRALYLHAKNEDVLEDGDALTELIDNLCSVSDSELGSGWWLSYGDIVQQDDLKLNVQIATERRKCKGECDALKIACKKLRKGKQREIKQLLLSGGDKETLMEKICTDSCQRVSADLSTLKRWKDESPEKYDEL
eukprot:TRINITY_DN56407_c0_g1_i1.p1 TRINITY_DN56407_c0_g1~~TRINITY_DN56407_c0_g1_i1.p1  ORF type:complete len:175 (-),score=37.90 TRINITY_DN56407_c0_g1_i1:69-593(-)